MQVEEAKRDTEVRDIHVRLTHSESQRERQLLHPLGPVVAVLPFTFSVFDDKPTNDLTDIFRIILYIDTINSISFKCVMAAFDYAFVQVPIRSRHHLYNFGYNFLVTSLNSTILLATTGLFTIPFHTLVSALLVFFWMPFQKKFLRIIPVRNPRNDKTVYLTLLDYTSRPRDVLFNPKIEASFQRVGSTNLVTLLFTIACTFAFSVDFFLLNHNKTNFTTCVDPLLAGVFYNSGVIVQSCLIVVFFVMRSLYEYFIDSVTSKHFGSDGMPIINFACTYRILSFSLRSKTLY